MVMVRVRIRVPENCCCTVVWDLWPHHPLGVDDREQREVLEVGVVGGVARGEKWARAAPAQSANLYMDKSNTVVFRRN